MFTPKREFGLFAVAKFLSIAALMATVGLTSNASDKSIGNEKQISDTNIHLPVSTCAECRFVSYEVSATNGCYTWENSNPSLITMEPKRDATNSECVDTVLLTPATTRASKSLVWVTATDKNSGQVLRAKVKVGEINGLQIQSHYRQFDVHDNQHFIVEGFDDEGNRFDSLNGLRFDWTILSGSEIIKKVTVPEAERKVRKATDTIFFHGLEQGNATIQVQIIEPGYENIDAASLEVTVVHPFVLLPSEPLYIMPTCEFRFAISRVCMADSKLTFDPIAIPSKQYEWDTDNYTIGTVSNDGTFTSRVTEGRAQILVTDQKMLNNTAEGSIRVVYPYRLEASIVDVTEFADKIKGLTQTDVTFQGSLIPEMKGVTLSEENATKEQQILIEEHFYYVRLTLFDKDGNLITLTENLRFDTQQLATEHTEVLKSNLMGSEIVFKTKVISSDQVKITSVHKLKEIRTHLKEKFNKTDVLHRLIVEKELMITKPVKIQHPASFILLPFLPSHPTEEGVMHPGDVWTTRASGGSGVYQWTMVNPEIASVKGSATIRSLQPGTTKLICRDHRNHRNFDTIVVEVSHVNSLIWVEEQLELRAKQDSDSSAVVSGERRVLSVIALDNLGRKFTNCTAIHPEFSVKGDSNIELSHIDHPTFTKYELIKEYTKSEEKSLLRLKQTFDEHKGEILATNLPKSPSISDALMFYHNFGICAQTVVTGHKEGLSRVKASISVSDSINGPLYSFESEFAEVAVYSPLKTVGPNHKPFLSDLYSTNQLGQEFQTFENFFREGVYSVQIGAEFIWSVAGGTNFWQDYKNKYQTDFKHSNLGGELETTPAISVATALELTTKFHMKVRCLDSEDLSKSRNVRLEMFQESKQTRHLMRPAKHTAAIDVRCDAPKTGRLLWSQQNRHGDYQAQLASQNTQLRPFVVKPLPRSRVVQNDRTHFVLVNSKHYVRYVLLNDQHQVSLNSSSVHARVETSNDSLASVFLQRESDKATYLKDVELGFYDKRQIEFKNLTGSLLLNLQVDSYFSDILQRKPAPKADEGWSLFGNEKKHKEAFAAEGDYASIVGGATRALGTPLRDSMRIEVVRNVEVEPIFKILYVGSAAQQSPMAYKIKVLEGSGHFSVSLNDTSKAELVHKDRELFIYPKAVGGLTVHVEDLEVPESRIAVSQILISDIARISLQSNTTLIEEGDSLNLLVTAFASNGQEFDIDQQQFMNFDIETENTGVLSVQGLQTRLDSEDKLNRRVFQTFGKIPGIYQLTAYTLKHYYLKSAFSGVKTDSIDGQKVTIVSDMLKIEVYPLLEFLPKNLLLTPNMRYTLQIVGGPQRAFHASNNDGSHIEIRFDIDDVSIASIDSFRDITAHRVGDATLKYEIIQLRSGDDSKHQSRVVSKKTVPIRVRLVTEVEIPLTHLRQIYEGSIVKLQAALKYNHEYFHFGLAPLSFDWKSETPEVLSVKIPNKEDLGMASSMIFASKTIRDNENRNDAKKFHTNFNSSSVYATAFKEGDALLNVQVAIEYPDEYRNEKNWFLASATVKIVRQLSISVPKYSHNQQETSLYLIPPNALAHIQTNKATRLKLAYSQQSVYDYSTQTYSFVETKTPIIQVVNHNSIRTFDKYGKVTLIVEEGDNFSDQLAMLNVLIADVYSFFAVNSYDALSLPLGSKLEVPIHFLNEHALRFAQNIEGIKVGIVLSHPRVVSAQFDAFNQTLLLTSQGSGECNVVLYLEDHPHIFDVVRVKVSSVVKPLSPVALHLGGTVDFKVFDVSSDSQSNLQKLKWSSSDTSVLSINSQTGNSVGLAEGRAEVLLSNHANAASIVYVNKVSYGQVDQGGAIRVNVDGTDKEDQRIHVRFFLPKLSQGEEITPTVQYDGVTLIRQNVQILCKSDQPDFLIAEGEVHELEGYFCRLRYNYAGSNKHMPRFVKVFVYASAQMGSNEPLYTDKVAEFEVQLTSSIKVETLHKAGVKLNRAQKSMSVAVFSSTKFDVAVEYLSSEEGSYLMYQLTREDLNSNEYNLTVSIPAQVSHSFSAKLVMSSPQIDQKTFLLVTFDATDSRPTYTQQYVASEKPVFTDDPKSEGTSWFFYFLFTLALLAVGYLCFTIFGQSDSSSAKKAGNASRYPARQSNDIRDPRGSKRPVYGAKDSSFFSAGMSANASDTIHRRLPQDLKSQPLLIDRVDYSGRRDKQPNVSLYSNFDEYKRY